MSLDKGAVLQDRYRIVSLLGQGGMGAVYRAWDTRLNVPVALKEMTPQPGIDPMTLAELRKQFQQEALTLGRLSHANLVRVTDFFEEGSNAYLVMDFVEGESLADRIARDGALSENEVLSWAEELLDALIYCHGKGVLHRDIKPQNVIIRSDGSAVLVDFGLVKLWDPSDPHTKTAMRGMGTPEYAPPEQYDAAAGHTDPRTDVYGLGATLYHAFSGKAPPTATMRIADPAHFVPLKARAPHVSDRTADWVMKALELDRAQRWQYADEMAHALGTDRAAFVAQVPAAKAAPRATPAAQTRPKRGLPKWVWAVGGIGLVGVALVIALVVCGVTGGALFGGGDGGDRVVVDDGGGSSGGGGDTGGSGTILLVNESASTVCFVNISPVTDDTWGDDWLGETEVVQPGQSRSFDVDVGNYDLRALDCDTDEIDVRWNVLVQGSFDWRVIEEPTPTGDSTLTLRNNLDQTICYVYISPTTDDTWGNDWLGASEVIAAGATRVFNVNAGAYDLRADDCDRNELAVEWGMDISGAAIWDIP